MSRRDRSLTWRSILLNARALALGALVGVMLIGGYEYVATKLAEKELGVLLVPPIARAEFAVGFGIGAALIIVLLCVPIWLLLERYDLDGWVSAAALGFVVTMAFWIFHNGPGSLPGHSLLELVRSGLPLAISGGVAGFVTWWARPKSVTQPQLQSSSSS